MARPEDLNLRDEPLPESRSEDDAIQPWLSAIEEMRSSGQYDWADDTLTRIYDWIYQSRRISEGQKKAIRNVLRGRERAMEELGLEGL